MKLSITEEEFKKRVRGTIQYWKDCSDLCRISKLTENEAGAFAFEYCAENLRNLMKNSGIDMDN